jgi:hypothetical protein
LRFKSKKPWVVPHLGFDILRLERGAIPWSVFSSIKSIFLKERHSDGVRGLEGEILCGAQVEVLPLFGLLVNNHPQLKRMPI